MRLLMIVGGWPSKQHPYLVYLFSSLRDRYPKAHFFLFRKETDIGFASKLIGKEKVDLVLMKALYRLTLGSKPVTWMRAVFRIIMNLGEALSVFRRCKVDGYRFHQALGQLLYNYELLGRQYDLVYINALQSARHISIRAFFPSSKVIASSRGQDFDWNPSLYDKTLREIDHLHVLGLHLQSKATERGFPIDRITIIPPAFLPSNETYHEPSLDNTLYVVSASRLVWTKGYSYAIRAFARMIERLPEGTKCKYIILGDGPESELMASEITRLRMEQHVTLLGWVDQVTVNQWLGKASIYLLLSIAEGFNNSVLQAQAFGLPCIVSDAGGLPENVLHDETGYVAPRYDVETTAEYLYRLAVDANLRIKMGNKSKSRVLREFELSKQVGKYVAMFESVLSNQ